MNLWNWIRMKFSRTIISCDRGGPDWHVEVHMKHFGGKYYIVKEVIRKDEW